MTGVSLGRNATSASDAGAWPAEQMVAATASVSVPWPPMERGMSVRNSSGRDFRKSWAKKKSGILQRKIGITQALLLALLLGLMLMGLVGF